jgi:hypothetical protein
MYGASPRQGRAPKQAKSSTNWANLPESFFGQQSSTTDATNSRGAARIMLATAGSLSHVERVRAALAAFWCGELRMDRVYRMEKSVSTRYCAVW